LKNTFYPKPNSVDFDLRQLEIFTKVVEYKSFSKAANAVFLAQASVSERIATLENQVGVRLLDRLGRQVIPTKAGELLYGHAILMLEAKRKACLEIEDFLGMKRGEIIIGASTIPGEYILPEVVGIFRQKYPSVSIALTIADTNEIENSVREGYLELGVVGSRSPGSGLVCHELWKDELVLVIPYAHRWAVREEISIDEILEEPFILREIGSGTLKIMEEFLRPHGSKSMHPVNVVARLGSSTAVKEGVKAGLGISIISSRALHTELEAGILKVLKIKGYPMYRHFYLIRDERRTPSPLCRAMLDFLLAKPE